MRTDSALRKTLMISAVAGLTVVSAAACSSGSSTSASTSPSPSTMTESPIITPTPEPTSAEPTGTAKPVGAACTSKGLLAGLPKGATMVKFNCANVGDESWAAVRVNPGPTVYFEKAVGNKWTVLTKGEVCGTASAGLPPSILAYCNP